MHAQGVAHFKDIRYTNGITYGEMFLQNEYEMGRYNLDEADVATQRTRFELYEQVRTVSLLQPAVGLSCSRSR
jgi:glycyl-tRNA synthetase